jgi:hypothetical protein
MKEIDKNKDKKKFLCINAAIIIKIRIIIFLKGEDKLIDINFIRKINI